ncbi:hypothetical protein WB44_10290 [Synechococcus sp. WH 8020]|nr:hypothetical protein WB44_10290 [Synechococcus sp. WH 8020]
MDVDHWRVSELVCSWDQGLIHFSRHRIHRSHPRIAVERHAQASWLDPVMLEAHFGQTLTESCFQDECVV